MEAVKRNKETGIYEWAARCVDWCWGCEHNCRYCYARTMAIRAGKKTNETWTQMTLQSDVLEKNWQKVDGVTMLPGHHDITPSILPESLMFIRRLVESGNKLLIVSKPHFECIQAICQEFKPNEADIMFRFTMGNSDSKELKYWEPGAPSFEERIACLIMAFKMGHKTSVSCEPLLTTDVDQTFDLVSKVEPWTTHSIWLGALNKPEHRVINETGEDNKKLNAVLQLQSKWPVLVYHHEYKDNPKIEWKDSFKKIIGIHFGREQVSN